MKIRPVEAELFNADGQSKPVVAFRSFAKSAYEKPQIIKGRGCISDFFFQYKGQWQVVVKAVVNRQVLLQMRNLSKYWTPVSQHVLYLMCPCQVQNRHFLCMKGCIDFTRWLALLVPTLLTPGVCVCVCVCVCAVSQVHNAPRPLLSAIRFTFDCGDCKHKTSIESCSPEITWCVRHGSFMKGENHQSRRV